MKQITHFLEDESPTLSKKLDCRFYELSSVMFSKKMRDSVREKIN